MGKILFAAVILLAGCSKDSASPTVVNHKSLFSIWTRDDQALTFNFGSGSFSTFTSQLTTSGGQRCSCSITLSGDENSGNYTLASCSYVVGTGAGTDPGCASLNETGTYRREDPNLKICTNGTTCGTYR